MRKPQAVVVLHYNNIGKDEGIGRSAVRNDEGGGLVSVVDVRVDIGEADSNVQWRYTCRWRLRGGGFGCAWRR